MLLPPKWSFGGARLHKGSLHRLGTAVGLEGTDGIGGSYSPTLPLSQLPGTWSPLSGAAAGGAERYARARSAAGARRNKPWTPPLVVTS